MKRRVVAMVVLMLMLASGAVGMAAAACDSATAFCFGRSAYRAVDTIRSIQLPEIAIPLWRVDETTSDE